MRRLVRVWTEDCGPYTTICYEWADGSIDRVTRMVCLNTLAREA